MDEEIKPNVWIVAQFTDPISNYVFWTEDRARSFLTHEPQPLADWGAKILYAGHVTEVDNSGNYVD